MAVKEKSGNPPRTRMSRLGTPEHDGQSRRSGTSIERPSLNCKITKALSIVGEPESSMTTYVHRLVEESSQESEEFVPHAVYFVPMENPEFRIDDSETTFHIAVYSDEDHDIPKRL